MSEHLQRCHVIEGMVQLLTNGLVLQLLSIQFIWRSEVDRKESGTAATQTKSQKQDKNERQMEAKRRGRKEKTKKK